MKYTLLFLLLFSQQLNLFAQKEDLIWLFNQDIEIDFNSGKPVYRNNPNNLERYTEGSLVVCNKNGSLLFYGDGENLWNFKHELIFNGDNLGGNKSTTQSMVAIQSSEYQHKYHIFSLDHSFSGHSGELYYAQLDMSKNDGLGEVVEKGEKLVDNVNEKMVAISHRCNGAWLLVQDSKTANFLAYRIKDDKLDRSPVISGYNQNILFSKKQPIGEIKYSPETNAIALVSQEGLFELYKFNRDSGICGNKIELNSTKERYSVAFSPNGRYLYQVEKAVLNQSDSEVIVQYDISNWNKKDIRASRVILGPLDPAGITPFRSIKKGPDDKLYFLCRNTHNALYVLNQPNDRNNFDGYYIEFESTLGSKNFPQDLVKATKKEALDIPDTTICNTFQIDLTDKVSEIIWFDSQFDKKREFSTPGRYSFLYEDSDGCAFTDTFSIQVSKPELQIPDTTVCREFAIDLSEKEGTIQWEDGSTEKYRLLTETNSYRLALKTADGCVARDTFALSLYPVMKDTISAKINQGETYTWYDSLYMNSGIYQESYIDDNGCEAFHYLDLTVDQILNNDIYIPTVFTPNGDGKNDTFHIYSSTSIVITRFVVFDKWGNQIYEQTGPFELNDLEWDGRGNGMSLDSGVYAYYFDTEDLFGTKRTYSGSVTLLR